MTDIESSPRSVGGRETRAGVRTTYGRYIGRVGALAVALGVAGAWGSAPMAWADEQSTSSSGATPQDAPSASDGNAERAEGAETPQHQEAIETAPTPDEALGGAVPADRVTDGDGTAGTQTVTSPEAGVIVRSSGGALTSSRYAHEHDLDREQVAEVEDDADADEAEGRGAAARTSSIAVEDDSAITVATGLPADALDMDGASTVSGAHQHVEPAATPLSTSSPRLPTPTEFINQIGATLTTAITKCACAVVNQVQSLLSTFSGLATPTPSTPTDPAQSPVAWTVLAWVRRQADYLVAAFNRSVIGVWVNDIGTRITQAVADFGNSPFGREISARVVQFLAECQESTELPEEFDRTTVISGLSEPTDFAFLTEASDPDAAHRIFVTEKSGTIKVFDPATGALTDLTSLTVVTGAGERGLIGIEVDPNFWTAADGEPGRRTIYVAYTGADNRDRLSSLVVNDTFDGVIETELVVSDQLANEFHHGGEIAFDPAGEFLYWAVGNNTVNANSQNLSSIHGKILRLNRDGTAAEGNPFEDEPGADAGIYALGFRNPFRFAFTPDGTLLAGDVGEATWEELNVVTAGANYGWPDTEGPCAGCGFVDPLYAYRHSAGTASAGSITAVAVYTGSTFPTEYRNRVFIADYSVGWIRELTFDSEYTSLISERTFDSGAGAVVKLAQGPDGNLYQLNIYPGTLSVIAPSGGNRAPTAVITASATSGAGTTLNVQLSAANSTDPDNDTLSYQWDLGNGTTSTDANPTAVYTNSGDFTAYTVTLTVSDGEKQNVVTQRIVVGATPPTASITVSNARYDAGDTVTFDGTGFDHLNQPLSASAYEWSVEFHHAEHLHPFLDNVIGTTGSITVPRDYDQLYNTFYRIVLTVTDRSGLKTTEYVDVTPNLVTLTFGSNDPDATYTIDGLPYRGQRTELVVVGVRRTLGTPSVQQVRNGQQLAFGSWSDGGAQTHVVVTPEVDTAYQVTFVEVPAGVTVSTQLASD